MSYIPYGKVLKKYEANAEKFLFTDKERDGETNYDYFGARYYDSDIGRFTGVDPNADQYPSWTPYHYVHNNPNIMVDLMVEMKLLL